MLPVGAHVELCHRMGLIFGLHTFCPDQPLPCSKTTSLSQMGYFHFTNEDFFRNFLICHPLLEFLRT